MTLLLLWCHPALSPPSQVALTLRAVGGLTTAQIARAFLAPEATMAQRISRAKQQIKAAGARFQLPTKVERPQRLAAGGRATPTGRRCSRSTTCSPGSPPTPLWRSTGPSRWP